MLSLDMTVLLRDVTRPDLGSGIGLPCWCLIDLGLTDPAPQRLGVDVLPSLLLRGSMVSIKPGTRHHRVSHRRPRPTRRDRHEVPTDHHDPGPDRRPADELAALYAERWEIESIFDELKTHQRGLGVVLRSRTPEGVHQEPCGYLRVHYALRALIHGAAHDHDLDPDRISFTTALHAARRSIRTSLSETVNLTSALRAPPAN